MLLSPLRDNGGYNKRSVQMTEPQEIDSFSVLRQD